jgi:alginate O-acetyltransferase complex protein AlgI
LVVNTGFVIFRADSLEQAGGVLAALVGLGAGDGLVQHVSIYLRPDVGLLLCVAAVGSVPTLSVLKRLLERHLPRVGQSPLIAVVVTPVVLLLLFLLVGMSLTSSTHNPFIYFRF